MAPPADNTVDIPLDKTLVVSDHLEDVRDHVEDGRDEDSIFVEGTREEKALVRKIDTWLMPTAWVLLLFNYMDRSNIGNALVAGMGKDLNFDGGNDFYHTIIAFQIAYVVGGPISSMIIVHIRPSIYLPLIMLLWGTCVTSVAAVQTTGQLLAIRFLLGICEAGFSPAMLFLISSWYRKHEQAKRVYFFYSSAVLAGAFGGIIAGVVTRDLEGVHGIRGWRWLFIIEGVITIGLALFAPFFLLDFPANSKKFTEAERKLALKRLKVDGIESPIEGKSLRHNPLQAMFRTLKNWRTWVLAIPYMQLVGSSSLAYFFPSLVRGLGYTAVTAQFMTAPIYVIALVIGLPLCWYADQVPQWRAILIAVVITFGCIFSALATGILNYAARYVFLCFINTAIWGGSPICVSYATSSMSGVPPEERATTIGVIVAMSQLAPVYASSLFPATDGPVYLKGFATYTALLGFAAVVSVLSHFLLKKYPYKAAA